MANSILNLALWLSFVIIESCKHHFQSYNAQYKNHNAQIYSYLEKHNMSERCLININHTRMYALCNWH